MAPHLDLADSNKCEYSQRNADQDERQKPGIDLMSIPVYDYRKGHDNQSDQRHKYAPRPTVFECELRRRNEHGMAFRRGRYLFLAPDSIPRTTFRQIFTFRRFGFGAGMDCWSYVFSSGYLRCSSRIRRGYTQVGITGHVARATTSPG